MNLGVAEMQPTASTPSKRSASPYCLQRKIVIQNAVERNPFPLGETKNTPNNYSSTSLLIHERASNNTTVRLVFGRFIFRYAGA